MTMKDMQALMVSEASASAREAGSSAGSADAQPLMKTTGGAPSPASGWRASMSISFRLCTMSPAAPETPDTCPE